MPVKWLALESITQKIYNTKTDVWSFGIFMWELFSLSSNPYPNFTIERLITSLEDGYRMPQPKYATLDIYDIMLACWRVSPPKRPNFKELSDLLSAHMTSELKQVVSLDLLPLKLINGISYHHRWLLIRIICISMQATIFTKITSCHVLTCPGTMHPEFHQH